VAEGVRNVARGQFADVLHPAGRCLRRRLRGRSRAEGTRRSHHLVQKFRLREDAGRHRRKAISRPAPEPPRQSTNETGPAAQRPGRFCVDPKASGRP
jgi:hypothetical protein